MILLSNLLKQILFLSIFLQPVFARASTYPSNFVLSKKLIYDQLLSILNMLALRLIEQYHVDNRCNIEVKQEKIYNAIQRLIRELVQLQRTKWNFRDFRHKVGKKKIIAWTNDRKIMDQKCKKELLFSNNIVSKAVVPFIQASLNNLITKFLCLLCCQLIVIYIYLSRITLIVQSCLGAWQ